MNLISNPKIKGFQPVWADFKGFSLLFDNPGNALTPVNSLNKIDCPDDSSALRLYQALAQSMGVLGPDKLMNACLFCCLPPQSYHVTVWDGVNDGNINGIGSGFQQEMAQCLNGFPNIFLTDSKIFDVIHSSALASMSGWTITFTFDSLAIWSNSALVARLAPADESSRNVLDTVLMERRRLSSSIGDLLGLDMQKEFKPHVSLGYFANSFFAGLGRKCLERMERVFLQKTENLSISFNTISLYGFSDMVTFLKK